jgi:hypothetical protein
MTTMMVLLVDFASAGSLFYIDAGEAFVQAMDTRTFEASSFAPLSGLSDPVAGIAFDQYSTLWIHYQAVGWWDLIWLEYPYSYARDWYSTFGFYNPGYAITNVIVFDQEAMEIVVFGYQPVPGIFHLAGSKIVDSLGSPAGAAWDPNQNGFVAVDGATRDIYTIVNYGPPQLVGAAPIAVDRNTMGLAYDYDTHILWLVTSVRGIFGLDPFTYEQVAWLPSPPSGSYGGTSYNYDPVPDFEPELLVTGTCPGEVFVTAIDHTPGGQVKIFSGTRPGTLVSPPGAPCAGASLGIRNPVLRGTLTANSLGLASTKFQAPASMCGSWRFQAVDVSTCTPSSVRGLP